MRKVCVVITARPSYSRVRSVLTALRARPDVELQVVAAASAVVTRFGRVADQIRADGFDVTEAVDSVMDKDTLCNSAKSTGLLTLQLAGTFERLRPDVVVTIADRHETLATAIASSYQHIPLCHIQGGEVTGSIDDKVRNAVTQLADVHCVATEGAASNVTYMRASKNGVHLTGCPSIDLAAEALRLGPTKVADVIVLQHPVTDQVEQAGDQMRATIEAVGTSALYFWPGEDAGGSAMSKALRLAGINPVRNLPPLEFLRALLGAQVLVGNSSVGIRECSFLGVPVVNIGTRQQGRERAHNVVDVPHDTQSITAAIYAHVDMKRVSRPSGIDGRFYGSTLYGDGHAGERIAGILAGAELRRVA
jgi:UDP-hydrolysing UDP-N-acetyl-D-glucosamine 2-epimerase